MKDKDLNKFYSNSLGQCRKNLSLYCGGIEVTDRVAYSVHNLQGKSIAFLGPRGKYKPVGII